ncbi:MAG: GtrA family protein [Verrucomicrobiae bacterium]|nr:GtrA family protein [Verrucomicrobiae bacterium]
MKPVARVVSSELWLLFSRYARFCIVGGSGVGVDMAVIWLLADPMMLHWNLTLSKIIAAEVAIFNNFLWNDIWTFRELATERTGGRARLLRLAKFNVICVAGIALSVLLLNVQVSFLNMNVYLANLLSIVAVSIWNFGMTLKFGWGRPSAKGTFG